MRLAAAMSWHHRAAGEIRCQEGCGKGNPRWTVPSLGDAQPPPARIGLIGLALLAAGVAMYVTERLRLECLAPTSYVDRGDGCRAGSIGFPFLAGGSLRTGRFAFSKTNPPLGENAARFGNREPPPLSPQCAH